MRKINVKNRIFALILAFCMGVAWFMSSQVSTYAEAEVTSFATSASVVVNNNVPEFTEDEITTSSYESYGELDSLGRVTTAMACIGQDLMPTTERGSIADIRPTGWQQNKYPGIVDSDPPYLYNRCHMIGYQLTGENANEKNLLTGTRYMNVEGMLPYENEVAEYIRSTGNHVMYRVTPVFEGSNLLCDGVQIEAYSVEDGGRGVSFNVFCYNVQPGVEINYADGSNELAESADAAETSVLEMTGGTSESSGENVSRSMPGASGDSDASYILNTNTKKFHYPYCSSVSDMKEKNKEYSNKSREEIIADGYTPCKRCNP